MPLQGGAEGAPVPPTPEPLGFGQLPLHPGGTLRQRPGPLRLSWHTRTLRAGALGFWLSPLAPSGSATFESGRADVYGSTLSAAEHPNKETPLFLSEWICLDWGDAGRAGEKQKRKQK
ncbi:MNX1 isoform 6 [Pongo abelii]|uniref:MNX1 isoform 6 n=1 Tax=Pongo abelii TaxID=9601 RepID=A0A2J8TDX5_PONAB|nr:MNX1 isoform 6 [Pongo abelii]